MMSSTTIGSEAIFIQLVLNQHLKRFRARQPRIQEEDSQVKVVKIHYFKGNIWCYVILKAALYGGQFLASHTTDFQVECFLQQKQVFGSHIVNLTKFIKAAVKQQILSLSSSAGKLIVEKNEIEKRDSTGKEEKKDLKRKILR